MKPVFVLCLVLAGASLGAGAWYLHEQRSELVQRVEQAGVGSVSELSVDDLMRWFDSGHASLALQIAGVCQAKARTRAARWTISNEGRVCRAAIHTASLEALRSTPAIATN